MKKKLLVTMCILTMATGLTGCAGCGSEKPAQGTEAMESTEQVEDTEATEQVIEATEEVEMESTEDVLMEATEEVEMESTETAEQEAEFQVTERSAVKYAKSSVNTRKGPSTDYEKVGSLSKNQKVTVTGQADNGWYRIDVNGTEAYVSNKYLVDEKVAENTGKTTGNSASTGTGTTTDNTAATGNSDNTAATGSGNNTGSTNAASGNNNNGNTGNTNASTGGNVVTPSTPEVNQQPSTDSTADSGNSEGLTPDQQAAREEEEARKQSTANLLEGAEMVGGDGSFQPATDGYGDGITITIEPVQ